jgi:hypothetical protein
MIPAEAVDLAELIDRTINDEYDPGDDVMGTDLAPAILAAGWRKQHQAAAVDAVMALHNSDGMRWAGFPRADKQETYCTHCQHAAPCPTVQVVMEALGSATPYMDEVTMAVEQLEQDIRDIPVTVISGPPADLTGVLAKHLHDLGYRKVEQ